MQTTNLTEFWNVLTHILPCLAGCALLPYFWQKYHNKYVMIFLIGSCACFGSSAAYHAIPDSVITYKLDKVSIYGLMVCSYIPITSVLKDDLKTLMLYSVCGLCLIGVILELYLKHISLGVSAAIYLMLGHLVIFGVADLTHRFGWLTIRLLVLGGLTYSFGVIFLLGHFGGIYSHAWWHLAVIMGNLMHLLFVIKITEGNKAVEMR